MARSANQKLKLLLLRQYLERNSDEAHPVTTAQLLEYLASEGISAERILIAVVENVPVPLRLS